MNPPTYSSEVTGDPFFGPPLGLAYVAGAVSTEGHDVQIIDCVGKFPIPEERCGELVRYGISKRDFLKGVIDYVPDLIGIACPYYRNKQSTLEIVSMLRKEYRDDVPLVLGGPYASLCPEEFLQAGLVDFVVFGEGEVTFTELCGAIDRGGEVPEIPGTIFRDGSGAIVRAARRERIPDLARLPRPRRDLLPMREYFAIDRARWSIAINDMRWPKTSMITSRGCPETCLFCSVRCLWGRKWVPRSPQDVVNEIEELIDEYGIREVNFLDDSISVNQKRLRDLCQRIIDRKIDVKWVPSSGAAIRYLDKETLKMMKRSGCYRLSFGLESGDPDVLAFIRKRYTHDRARQVIHWANMLGIWTTGTFIFGFPYETREQMERTYDFAVSSGIDFAFFYTAAPYPGTDLLEICNQEGIEVPSDPSLVKGGAGSLLYSPEEIRKVRDEAIPRFIKSRVLRPWKMLLKIRSLEDLKYAARIALYFARLLASVLKRG